MQSKHLYSYSDYKYYINDRLDGNPEGRGARSALARSINCQSAYVSSVLRGNSHFTPEQGEAINQYLEHSESESDYFMLLLQWQRAGTEPLKRRLKRQMEKIRETRFDLKKRLPVKPILGLEDQLIYYSEWYYTAIHALVSLPGFQTIGAIASRLRLETAQVANAVEFLTDCGILVQEKNSLKIGMTQIHLGAESPLISKHHVNWRLQAMNSLAARNNANLHYSSVISVSGEDADSIKEMIVALIQSTKSVVRESKEEKACCFALDFFEL